MSRKVLRRKLGNSSVKKFVRRNSSVKDRKTQGKLLPVSTYSSSFDAVRILVVILIPSSTIISYRSHMDLQIGRAHV